MLKSGEKLRKLFMLLATWGLLLAFFIAYERYFIMGQREFLKDDGFRALTTLSGELNAQVQKVQKSSEASIKLAAPDHWARRMVVIHAGRVLPNRGWLHRRDCHATHRGR
jgi:predicted deacetylase